MNRKKQGFTLIELLVVIAIIAMLAAILVPAVSSALLNAAMTTTSSNGRSIYMAAFGKSLDNLGGGGAWPESSEFSTSTDYFVNLVTSKVMNVTYDFFSAKGVRAAKSSKESDFAAVNNAWNLVTDLTDGTSDGTPFLFTKNLESFPASGNTVFQSNIDTKSVPFGDQGVVVVHKGGAAYKLKDTDMTGSNFDPSGDIGDYTLTKP